MASVSIRYDQDADAAFIYFGEGASGTIVRTEMCDVDFTDGAAILLLDDQDRIVGLEILGASRLLDPILLSQAAGEKP
jgi:uncharacterized protein YuzE